MKLFSPFVAIIVLFISSTTTKTQDFDSFLNHYSITKDFVQHHNQCDQDIKKLIR
ncbi:hypothetical protein Noda2021_09910 [Candidatus Dependentiae bacterium Noda2021]|nr:hypothetical protein Noda2021_09910 [Candidatus Dependentiae bacterium Noda2021]